MSKSSRSGSVKAGASNADAASGPAAAPGGGQSGHPGPSSGHRAEAAVSSNQITMEEDPAGEDSLRTDQYVPKETKSFANMGFEADEAPPSDVRRTSVTSLKNGLKRCMSNDVLPHMDHYRHRLSIIPGRVHRPTLENLIDPGSSKQQPEPEDVEAPVVKPGKVVKFGWIEGVFMRCLLNIWGVMLFLRLTWVVGEAGLIEGFAIIALANVVTIITGISMSAVSTNGQIKGGGIYYMISRSLGPEFGGAIGLMFTIANSIAVAVYLIGFCDSLLDMIAAYVPGYQGIIGTLEDRLNDVRLIGSVTLVLILGLVFVGMDWVTRVQKGLLFLLLASQVDFIIGSFLPASDEEKVKGFVGYSSEVAARNLYSDYRFSENKGTKNSFFSVFAVFFPAVTGIVAGANLSGDLKNPSSAIPKGTLLAIGATCASYLGYAVMVGCCALREASGVLEELNVTETFVGPDGNITYAFDDCTNRTCAYGTLNSYQMLTLISAWGPLIYFGCFAATLSSAIASLVGAPRVFQALCKDKLFPYVDFFGEGYGANNDPVRGYVLVFFVSLICVFVGKLDVVSSLLSNFFVAAYTLINFSVFHASLMNSPGWRPSFKYYNKWVSLLGTVLCVAVMFLMDVVTALCTFVIIVFLYLYVSTRKPDVNWGSSTQSQTFMTALKSTQSLVRVVDHVKNYRPKVILFAGFPPNRPCLLDFANLLTKRLSFLQVVDIVTDGTSYKEIQEIRASAQDWMHDNKVKAFYTVARSEDFHHGARSAIEMCGLGKLSANMVLIGFKEHWTHDLALAEEYYRTLLTGFEMHLGVGVLRVPGGMNLNRLSSGVASAVRNLTKSMSDSNESLDNVGNGPADSSARRSSASDSKAKAVTDDVDQSSSDVERRDRVVSFNAAGADAHRGFLGHLVRQSKTITSVSMTDGVEITDERLVRSLTQFRSKDECTGTIDVYWLFDDGGLTLLLPYILTTRKRFRMSKIRVFFMANGEVGSREVDEEVKNMAALLAKFRIQFQDVVVLTDVAKKPSKATRREFDDMIGAAPPNQDCYSKACLVPDEELKACEAKTNFHLRIAEIVRLNSSRADLVAMTLPLPKMGQPSHACLYLAWLDYMSRNMPPFLFVRGNQDSVLTFYS